MSRNLDRLYELLPLVHRMRDADQGYPLKALLAVVNDQVNVIEDDIAQLYENWFIETCEDWVVPYIGDLIGYRPVNEAGAPRSVATREGRMLNKALIPRREVANTLALRRRKGTLALLELLASDVAGWPVRVEEFYRRLGWMQHLNHLRPGRGKTLSLRNGRALGLIGGPFDTFAHSVDVRRIVSTRSQGRYNIGAVGIFVWRLKVYPVTNVPAVCIEEQGSNCFTFNILSHNTPLYNSPQPEESPTHIAEEINLPVPLRRRALEVRTGERPLLTQASKAYYGEAKSLLITVRDWPKKGVSGPIPAERIIPADLSKWHYRVEDGKIAVDPELGRMMFPVRRVPKRVWVSYHYAFSANMGGGEYPRTLSQPEGATIFRVGRGEKLGTIAAALEAWHKKQQNEPDARAAVIEITDSGVYTEQLAMELAAGESLQIRAGRRPRGANANESGWTRPVVRLLDYVPDQPDAFSVRGKQGSRLVLEGLVIAGRGIQVYGPEQTDGEDESEPTNSQGDICDVTIRHCTLVPGWGLDCDCGPQHPEEPSLEIIDSSASFKIEHSIIGTIRVIAREVDRDPVRISMSDSILDATGLNLAAVEGEQDASAFASLSAVRCTVLGGVSVHSISLAENSIFMSPIQVARRQVGCIRFCYVTPGSRTPRRYHSEPDLAIAAVDEAMPPIPSDKRALEKQREARRVRPEFNSLRYGTPAYCQLANHCAEEIKRGADDESEMGAFHNLFEPQRKANLRTRLDEYAPAAMDAAIVLAS